MVPLIIGISLISFLVMYAAGDPITVATRGNPQISEVQRDLLRQYYGLDQPIPVQYLRWLGHFITGNLGQSLYSGYTVNEIIAIYAPETLKLQLISIFLAFFVSLPAGIYSALKQRSIVDYSISSLAIFGISIPVFFLGILLILLFSNQLGWLPSSGAYGAPNLWPVFGIRNYYLDAAAHLVLPVTVLFLASLAYNSRLLRAGMLETLRQDYIMAARASGIKERTILYKYALKNAITPLLTLLGLSIGFALAGAPMTEYVFSWPGLGRFFIESVNLLDFPSIMGITMVVTVLILIANLITDLAYAWVDPRVTID
jgi:ABC-type dipeptide/oligopeptide/nickel transport system permease component